MAENPVFSSLDDISCEAFQSNDAEHVTWIPCLVAYCRMYPLFGWARASQEWNVLCVMSPIQAKNWVFSH